MIQLLSESVEVQFFVRTPWHDDAEMLDHILTDHPETELVQLQLNYIDWENESVQSRKCYEVCVKHGVQITVMEPLKGGALVRLPEVLSAAIVLTAVRRRLPSRNIFPCIITRSSLDCWRG